MTLREKYLYHQIHPLKLLADAFAGFGSLYPLWQHELSLALMIVLIPPPIASVLVMRFANLERQKRARLGRYIAAYMNHAVEAVRLAGMIVMAMGAWNHSTWIIAGGLALILAGWLNGVLREHDDPPGATSTRRR